MLKKNKDKKQTNKWRKNIMLNKKDLRNNPINGRE